MATAKTDTGNRRNSPSPAPLPKRSLRLSIGTSLALVLLAVGSVFIVGNLLVQRTMRVATQEVALVQRQYEPLARSAREIRDALAAFDRSVLAYLEADGTKARGVVDGAHERIARAIGAHGELLETPAAMTSGAALHGEIGEHQRNGAALIERHERRREMRQVAWANLEAVRERIAHAGAAGLPQGENVFARRSLAELARALEGVTGGVTRHLASS